MSRFLLDEVAEDCWLDEVFDRTQYCEECQRNPVTFVVEDVPLCIECSDNLDAEYYD